MHIFGIISIAKIQCNATPTHRGAAASCAAEAGSRE
jgi:hypothetical protein